MIQNLSRLFGAGLFIGLIVAGDASAQTISTYAGGGIGDGGQAAEAYLQRRGAVALDAAGNLYIAEDLGHRVRRVDTNGIITTVAGNGIASFSGDGGPATSAGLNRPRDVAVDAAGNLYIADGSNRRVRKVTPAGVITTVAGDGTDTFVDNVVATATGFGTLAALDVDAAGNVYIVDSAQHRVRRLSTGGMISTVAGIGTAGYAGDGGPGRNASLSSPQDVAFDGAGILHIADSANNVIRKLASNGVISTVLGGGTEDGPNAPYANTKLNFPISIDFDAVGALYIAEYSRYRIRQVDGSILNTVVGNGLEGTPSGDGGSALSATLGYLSKIAVAPDGRIYISTSLRGPVRVATSVNYTYRIDRFAGGGWGHGTAATNAFLEVPQHVAAGADGTVVVGTKNFLHKIRPDGVIVALAGTGRAGWIGNGGPAVDALLRDLGAVVMGNAGEVYFSEPNVAEIRYVDAGGIMRNLATVHGMSGGLARDPAGNLYAGTGQTIHKITPDGNVSVHAGTGTAGFSGDGGPALQATFNNTGALVYGPDDALYVVDRGNFRVRRIGSDGVVTTVAGNGGSTYLGAGVATQVPVSEVSSLAADVEGNLYLGHAGSHRLLKLTPSGQLVEVAGAGTPGFSGDGGPAPEAQFNLVSGVAVLPVAGGDLFVVDEGNQRVRRIAMATTPTVPEAPAAPVAVAGDGRAEVSFAPPANDGGSPVTGYVVTSSPAGGVDAEAGTLSLNRVITGLANGTNYRFSVRAINALGPGASSNQSAPVVPRSDPTLSVSSASGMEGGQASFVVSLSEASIDPVRFNLRTVDGTASAGSDFTALALVDQVIPAGVSSIAIAVDLLTDTIEEGNETFGVVIDNITHATPGTTQGTGTIINRVNPPAPSVLATRADRFEQLENAAPSLLDVLRNDVSTASRLQSGSLAVTEVPLHGAVSVFDNGTPGTAHDDLVRYTPPADFSGEDVFAYRLCDVDNQCHESLVTVVLRPAPRTVLESPMNIGSTTVPLSGLRALLATEFNATPLTAPISAGHSPAADSTPWTPWDAAQAGTGLGLHVLPVPADGQPRSYRVLVELKNFSSAAFDLYAGVDSNGDGKASEDELRCTSAAAGTGEETCDFALDHPGTGTVRYWVLAHNVDVATAHATSYAFAVPMTPGNNTLVATGPAKLARGEQSRVTIGWDDPLHLDTTRRRGFVRVVANGGQAIGMFPVGANRVGTESAAVMLESGVTRTFRLSHGEAQERMFIDVPAGASSLTVAFNAATSDTVYLSKGGAPDLLVALAPPRSQALISTNGNNATVRTLTIAGSTLTPGRWYVTPVNGSDTSATNIVLTATITGAAPTIRSGSYFNAARAGHGLFLYPAADQRVGIWYTYLKDGTPTWYYLQGTQPGANGLWTSPIYRAVWHGTANKLTPVGRAVMVPTGPDTFRFSYSLDGEVGSEPMAALGRGCPMVAGRPLDSSSHWFDPASAGTGYSVQYFPDYEFYAAFVYDGQGIARYLLAERSGVGTPSETLALEQNTGFCPTCERVGTPVRSTVGTLQRTISGGALTGLSVNALYTGQVPGSWSAQDVVQPLGGPGTTQGCLP